MLFRLLLVLSVLLAPAEGAPIFIRHPRSLEQIRINEENVTVPPEPSEDAVYRMVIPAAILFALAVFMRPIAIIYGCLKKKKPMKDVESQTCANDFRENNTNLNGKREDYIPITISDLLHGPGNEQRDILTGNKISVPGPPDVIIDMSPYEDEVTSSDRKREDYKPITISDLLHGPGNEQRDILTGNKISVPRPPDVIIDMSPYEDEVTSSNRKREDYKPITISDLLHGPGNEQRDVLTGNKISVPGPPDVIIDNSPDEDEVTSSDRESDIFCTSGDITMLHKASIVEVKESKINPDLDGYRQTPPSILKGRNPMKNKSKGRNVSFQESEDRYVYIYDSESSQPGREVRYFRNKEGFYKKKNPAGGDNSTTTPLHGGYHVRIRQPVMKQNRHRFQDWSLHSPMDMTLTSVSAARHVHGQETYLLHNGVDSGIGLYSHPWM